MHLVDLVTRRLPPVPWEEGDNIPWDDPAFSERMLQEHLRQDTIAASRPFAKIDEQVRWIHNVVLRETPSRVLDLACGPGLYTSRLGQLGHECAGIDFSPASVAYAREQARGAVPACSYALADVRTAPFGVDFDLVMMTFGQINVFTREQARAIVARACAALRPGGALVLEPQRFGTVQGVGEAAPSWYAAASGLFSASPHVCLMESFWDATLRCSTQRFFVMDAETAVLSRYALTTEAYEDDEFVEILVEAGFVDVQLLPSLIGEPDDSQAFNLAVLGRKPGGA